MTTLSTSRFASSACLLLGIFLIAMNLRCPLTGIGPLLDIIRVELDLSATQAGMITTLPLLTFAFFSPIASTIGRRCGLEHTLMLSQILIIAGLMARSMGSTAALFSGTVIIGAGIALGNVLLPSLMKRDFPTKISTMTSLYVLVMGVGSAIIAAISQPLATFANTLSISVMPSWAFSLVSVIIFPILAVLVWLPQMRNHTPPTKDTAEMDSHSYLWRNIDAWHMTLFLALNSFLIYIFISWLPTILVEQGYSHHEAGVIHSLFLLFTAVPAIVLIPLMKKLSDKRMLSLSLPLMMVIGLVGLNVAPSAAIVWAMICGFGSGGGFIVALAMIGLRTETPHQAAALSGMSQFFAYIFAATGPILMGAIHEHYGDWHVVLTLSALLALTCCAFAVLASKSSIVSSRSIQKPLVSTAMVED
ncbi:MFS transporter [Shewanella youngdeokensis]|uniref:MFS transporter n=1 Tax=Shewanella youngdeokensis TaxID=2999068 RepID=A0ABZ0K218_9GAMM|nr:MFS transporter [Shewanella sp. DAU334]